MISTPQKLLIAAALIVLGIVLFFTLGPAQQSAKAPQAAPKEKTLYTCGMHPNVIQDRPGNCPICEMKLTPIRRSTRGETNSAAPGMSSISIDPVTIQNMGIRTDVVTNGPLRRVIRTVGTIDYSETALADVTTKFRGWIERLYVDATGQQVHKGDPLFEIYSPELYTAQREYLLATAGGSASDRAARNSLVESARLKLSFFDISSEQIAELEKTGEPRKALRVGAPIDGFVTEKLAVEGMMVEAGMRLYRLADLGLVWVYAEIYEQDLPFIRLGQEATVRLSYLPDRQFRGRVTYVYPALNEQTRTARVRMEFHNPGFLLKPGMFASVELRAELEPSALLVPDMAVLRSGTRNTVFVALEGGRFEPRIATLGPRGENDMLQVLSGLNEGERVVVSGQFMLDSESQLREAIQKMLDPGAAAGHARHGEPAERDGTQGTQAAGAPEPHSYVCPMPEHVSIAYEHPGKCPLCGMALVPVSAEALSAMQPGGRVDYYTCPMPEHSDVTAEKPGKCPKCGMTLVPVMVRPEPPAATAGREGATASAAPVPDPLYTCPMASHAHVVSDQPGKCPECEMTLVPASTVSHTKAAEDAWRKEQAAESNAPVPPAHQH
ncbi:MAG: efflux RND transporter periplasmic adaptor subunit [Verrucomicrobiia bacterium]